MDFYSTGDEVLFKGCSGLADGLGGTKWAGWGFNNVLFLSPTGMVVRAKYDASAAGDLSPGQLRADPVFNPHPPSMTNSVIPLLARGAILAQGIPALAPATGATRLLSPIMSMGSDFDLNSDSQETGNEKPNGWPSRNGYTGRWLHSDMKDVAFFYAYKFLYYDEKVPSSEQYARLIDAILQNHELIRPLKTV